MRPVFIYALLDPLTEKPRYVGQAVGPDRRLTRHIREARKNDWHVSRWIKGLLSKNLRPVMEIIDVVPDNEADFWEREYIQVYRELYSGLTNLTDGGSGCGVGEKNPFFGKKHTPETRAKISAGKQGILNPRFGKFGEDNPLFGRKHSPETRVKMSAAGLGKPKSPEHNAAVSAALRGRKFSKEHCAKISANAKKRIQTRNSFGQFV